MTTAYTSLLGLALPVQGELTGVWGDTVNNSITSLLDTSVAGTTNVSTDTDVTLTTTTGAANTARQAILLFSGARTALRTVTAPAQSKIYTVINATTGGFSVKLVGSGPTTGLTIPNGASATVAWNGSDFVEVGAGSIGNLTVNGNLTVTGTSTLTGAITNTAGTANGVAYLNGSKVVTSGSALTFDGTNVLTLFRTTGTEANEPTIKFSNLVFAGQNAGVIKSSNGGLALDIQSPSDSTYQLRSRIYMSGGSGDSISFQASSNNGSTYGERMVLTSTGLGIGTSSPATKLQVSANEPKIRITSTAGSGKSWDISSGGNTTVTLGHFSIYDTTTDAQRFNIVSGTGQMLLDGSGNLGLGVTPSAWGGSYKGFQVAATGVLASNGVNGTTLSHNAYYDGTNDKYLTTGAASRVFQFNGGIRFDLAPSGTAGNAITFTQAMTLDASGNLGVGTTSPATRLHVASNSSTDTTILVENNTANYASLLTLSANNNNGAIYNFVRSITNGGTEHWKISGGATVATMAFSTDSVERARIDGSGNLLVGTTGAVLSSNTFFKGSGASNPCLALVKNSSSSSTDQAFVVQNGNAGGTTSFQVLANGNAQNTNNSYGAISDAKLKDVIGKAPSYWDKFKQYEFVNYTLKADKSKLQLLGLVAQQVEQISPSLIEELPDADKDGNSLGTTTKGIKYSVVTLQAEVVLQEAQNRIEQLESIIESLKARLDAANL